MAELAHPTLDLLEKLLALTEADAKKSTYWREWQKISAQAADIRAQKKCGEKHGTYHWKCQLPKGHSRDVAHQDVYAWFAEEDYYRDADRSRL